MNSYIIKVEVIAFVLPESGTGTEAKIAAITFCKHEFFKPLCVQLAGKKTHKSPTV